MPGRCVPAQRMTGDAAGPTESVPSTCTSRVAVLLLLLAAVQFVVFIGYFPSSIIVTPYGDVLDWLSGFYEIAQQNLWQYLPAPHNGHRIVFTKLLTVADARLFAGLGYPVAWVCLSLLLALATLVTCAIWRSVDDAIVRRWAIAVAILLLFPTSLYPNVAYPVNSQHVIVIFFAMMACGSLTCSAAADGARLRRLYSGVCVAAACCASLASLNGMLVWPILLWMAWSLRLGRSTSVVIVLVGVFVIVRFGVSSSVATETGSSIAALGDIAHATRYLIEFHAMPWIEVDSLYWPAMCIGLPLLLLSVFFCLQAFVSPHGMRPITVVAIAMLMFSLATAIVIALGRHKMNLSPAHRYGIFLVVSCVALFVLVLPVFERWMANARTMRVVLGLT
ncbi:MAG: hypothetical protein ACI9DC_000913, partial [Gammaproteobacteria bacterium]